MSTSNLARTSDTSSRAAEKKAVPPLPTPSLVRTMLWLNWWANTDWISNRSSSQLHRDSGLAEDSFGDRTAQLEKLGYIQQLEPANGASRFKILRPIGPRRIDVSPETQVKVGSLYVWTKQCKLHSSENAAVFAVALGAQSNEEIAAIAGFQTTRRANGYKSFPGAQRAIARALTKLGPKRFVRLQRGGARVQPGGAYAIAKNVFEFTSTASDPDLLTPSFRDRALFRESDSAAEERERVRRAILSFPPDPDGGRRIFLADLADRCDLRRPQAKHRLLQLPLHNPDITIERSTRNKASGPFGPKGQLRPICIFVRQLSKEQLRRLDLEYSPLKPREWCVKRDELGIPLSAVAARYGDSWTRCYEGKNKDFRQYLSIIQAQHRKAARAAGLTLKDVVSL